MIIFWQKINQNKKNSYSSHLIKKLREKFPTTELFLIRIFLYSDWIQENIDWK